MELFFTTNSTSMDGNHQTWFERENAFTLRNFSDRIMCHEYPEMWHMDVGNIGGEGVS
jgi:hypothetical protein